jgi:dihydropteroate synthase
MTAMTASHGNQKNTKSLNCKGRLIDLSIPKVMGILNTTPDSFYDGGRYADAASILEQVQKMREEGAAFIDVGAYSSRPGAKAISEAEETKRLLPVVDLLLNTFPDLLISIDTFRSGVARKCLEKGACMINDISGGDADPKMFETVTSFQVPYILMHMQGTPQNMQERPHYENIVTEIRESFAKKQFQLKNMGLNDLIFDVGFGFGKTVSHNYELLQNLDLFHELHCPILTGVSRKSMLYKPLGLTPEKALNATTVAHTLALQKGSQILRVHDVAEAVQAVKITQLIRS